MVYRWNIFAIRCQFANFKPNQDVVLGQNGGRWCSWKWSEFGTAHGLTDRNAWGKHASWRWSCLEFEFSIFVQRMMLIVAEYLKHYGLGFQVLDKRFGDWNGDLR